MLKFGQILWLGILLLYATIVKAQAPQISYGPARSFLYDANFQSVTPQNTGGSVPQAIYSQTITFAGTGRPSANDGPRTIAGFHHPSGVVRHKNGTLYVTDEKNNSVRKIDPDGYVSTVAKGFNVPTGIAFDATGNIYVADCFNHRIRRISKSGLVTTLAGSGQAGSMDHSNPLQASFRYPVGVATDAHGNVYVVDEGNNKVRKISRTGAVSTLAGNGLPGDVDHENGRSASFNQPVGLTIDPAGNIFVADQLNHKIRKISPEGKVTTLAGTGFAGFANHTDPLQASFNNPRAVALGPDGSLYIADPGTQLIRCIAPNGEVSTLAGSGAASSTDHKNGKLASFFFPNGLATDSSGVYVADFLNNKIRRVEINGFAVEPTQFPLGMQFDLTTGTLSGQARELLPGETFQVTAYNPHGSSRTSLRIGTSSDPGNALKFDGLNDMVLLESNPDLTPKTVSAELWVKPGLAKYSRFLIKRNSVSAYDDSYSIGLDSNGYIAAYMADGRSVKEGQVLVRYPILPSPNKWYFLSAVFSEKSLQLYVDGELVGEKPSGFPLSTGPQHFYLNWDRMIPMALDEIRLFDYDRSARFKEDMLQAIPVNEPGLFLYYDFNQGEAAGNNGRYNTLFDRTAYQHDGEMQQFALQGNNSNWVKSYAMVVPRNIATKNITPNSFTVSWDETLMGKASHYLLDVATDRLFTQPVAGFKARMVSGRLEKVEGLEPGKRYFYRLRAYMAETDEEGGNSLIQQLTTLP